MDAQTLAIQHGFQRTFSSSRLCKLVLDFWALVLQQDAWGLKQPPGSLGATSDNKPTYPHEDDEDDDEMEVDDVEDDDHDFSGLQGEQASWNRTRFRLNEERDRLCLWKFSISDEDLDSLTRVMGSSSGYTINVFGGAILESLARIGQVLVKETEGVSGSHHADAWSPVRKELNMVVTSALRIIHEAFPIQGQVDGQIVPDISDFSPFEKLNGVALANEALGDEDLDFYTVLKSSIATLQSLSFLNILQTKADKY